MGKRFIAAALCAIVLMTGCTQHKQEAPSVPGRFLGKKVATGEEAAQPSTSAVEVLLDEVEKLRAQVSSLTGELEQLHGDASATSSAAASSAATSSAAASSAATSSAATSSAAASSAATSSAAASSAATSSQAPEKAESLAAAAARNADSKLWLTVPNTTIDEVVVQGKENTSYTHRDAMGNQVDERTRTNALMLDYECAVGSGSAEAVSQNLVIYGVNFGTWLEASAKTGWDKYYDAHYDKQAGKVVSKTKAEEEESDRLSAACEALTVDNPDGPKFSQLLKFTNIDFARSNPYIYVTTPAGELAYEIFAVAYTNANTDPPYNLASYSSARGDELIAQMLAKSLYNYKVSIQPGEKLLTLSTDTFYYAGKRDVYGDRAKFVVMARQMKPGEIRRTIASLNSRPSPVQPEFAAN